MPSVSTTTLLESWKSGRDHVNTDDPYDGCAIVAGENATMAVASAILLILSRQTNLSLSLCEIEIAYRRLIAA